MTMFQQAGEAVLLAYEGDRILAIAITNGVWRFVRRSLAWLGVHQATAREG